MADILWECEPAMLRMVGKQRRYQDLKKAMYLDSGMRGSAI